MSPVHFEDEMLRCPLTGAALRPAAAAEITGIPGAPPRGWVKATGIWFYPEKDGIPILLPGRAVSIGPGATTLPVAASTCDLVLGDGVFTTQPFPAGAGAMIDQLARVTKTGGQVILRIFAR